jgi:hypothetical protein
MTAWILAGHAASHGEFIYNLHLVAFRQQRFAEVHVELPPHG